MQITSFSETGVIACQKAKVMTLGAGHKGSHIGSGASAIPTAAAATPTAAAAPSSAAAIAAPAAAAVPSIACRGRCLLAAAALYEVSLR
jgi:hypothetical protein